MLVICCGMMRAGSTLQYQLCAEIVESLGLGKRMGWIDSIRKNETTNLSSMDEKTYVVKCHNYFVELTDIISRGDVKTIYVYRDIRDVVVSLINKFNQSYWQIVNDGYIETILKAYYDWTRLDDVLISRYETLIGNIEYEANRIAEYLGIEISNQTATQLSDEFSIDNQILRIQNFDYHNYGEKLPSGDQMDPNSFLHKNHIFSGQSNQWKTALSRIQIGLIEDKSYRWLVEVDYPISQPWIFRKVVGMGYIFYYHFIFRVLRFVGRGIQKLTKRGI